MNNEQNNNIDQNANGNEQKISEKKKSSFQNAKWLDNSDNEVKEVFGFNKNAELVNARAAMIGFLMMILTELAFGGKAVTHSIFGIN